MWLLAHTIKVKNYHVEICQNPFIFEDADIKDAQDVAQKAEVTVTK
ncbi:hypothetical protein [Oceanobacillus senegalensis]|nr:hypothetical protein [Oceanobacillus senegalensis]